MSIFIKPRTQAFSPQCFSLVLQGYIHTTRHDSCDNQGNTCGVPVTLLILVQAVTSESAGFRMMFAISVTGSTKL